MTTVKHELFASFVQTASPESLPRLILICGEPFLTQKSFDVLADLILQGGSREFGVETVDGASVSLGDMIEQLTTFSFFDSPKLVTVKDAPLFSASQPQGSSYGPEETKRLVNLSSASIPANHFLVFISRDMDRRRKIYKALEPHALIVDCTVPAGSLKSDRDAQIKVARSIAEQLVSQAQKTMEPRALQELMDRVGFSVQNIAANVEKLIAFSGKRSCITHEDVLALVKREKKDPVFRFTNAVLDRDVDKALFYLTSLLEDQFHPLQILKSLENQIRKLLVAKYFFTGPDSPVKSGGLVNMPFQRFTREIAPAIIARDGAVEEALSENFLAPAGPEKKKKKPPASDLLLAPNPKSLYPVFQVCQKSEHFTRKELESAIMDLADMDYQFKTSAISPVMVMEHFIIGFCTPGSPE